MTDLCRLSITEIKDLLASSEGNHRRELISAAEKDKRLGVRRLALTSIRELDRSAELNKLAQKMIERERELNAQGFMLVAGVDEVGRGCLAGPVVAAGVILPPDTMIPGLKDSKQLTEAERIKFAEEIKNKSLDWKIVAVENIWIDRYGLHRANLMALTEAAMRLIPEPDFLLIDGYSLPLCPLPQMKLIKGDSQSQTVAAASVIAKVYRDKLMDEAGKKYPQYGFERNKGYGTREHMEALKKCGPCDLHRRSFSPVGCWQEEQLTLTVELKSPKYQH